MGLMVDIAGTTGEKITIQYLKPGSSNIITKNVIFTNDHMQIICS